MELFPDPVKFSEEEQTIINAALSHPTVKRYFQAMALKATTDHAVLMVRYASEATQLPPSEISAKFAGLAGQLTVFETFINIAPVVSKPS